MRPMLAATTTLADIKYPVYASPKLDGVRGVIISGKLFSRALKPIPNAHVASLFGRLHFSGLDGELVSGSAMAKDVFRVTTSAVRSEKGTPDVKFYVFDNFLVSGGFASRFSSLESTKSLRNPQIVVLDQRLVQNEKELLKVEAERLAEGYEGLILRDPNGAYKFGRSTLLEGGMLKLKRFMDSEAEILEVEEEMENTNTAKTNELGRTARSSSLSGLVPKGRAGALAVRDIKTGVEFSIGTGMNDADKAFFWKNRTKVKGSLIRYKSFHIGVKDKPRFPVFLGLREKWDL